MKENEEKAVTSSDMSKSKQKRIEREKKNKAAKQSQALNSMVWVLIGLVIVAAIAALIATSVIKKSNQIVASSDYGAELSDDGFIKNVKANDYVTLCDYKNIKVPAADVAYTDEEMQEDIDTALNNHKELNSEDGVVADGDTVNIDYVGSIDGVEFDGGNSNGQGYDLEIGSGSFIDDFEEQLIGARVGEVVNVDVTFPDDYGSEELAGQDADFVVTINGVYTLPEFTDDFVAENLTAYASTVDEYKAYLKEKNESEKLTTYLESYLTDNSTANKYPKAYLKNLEQTTRYQDEQSYQYMNQMYMSYNGMGYSSFEEYNGMSDEEYCKELVERSKENCLAKLVDQAILENEGITITADDVKDSVGADSFDSQVESQGLNVLANQMIHAKVLDIVKGYAVVE